MVVRRMGRLNLVGSIAVGGGLTSGVLCHLDSRFDKLALLGLWMEVLPELGLSTTMETCRLPWQVRPLSARNWASKEVFILSDCMLVRLWYREGRFDWKLKNEWSGLGYYVMPPEELAGAA